MPHKGEWIVAVKFVFAWYDIWIGAYWDRARKRLYVLPIPCVGLIFCFGKDDRNEKYPVTIGNDLD